MSTRQDIVDLARTLIGTPWLHQGRQPKLGLDCIGLIKVVGENFGLVDGDYLRYGRQPIPLQMQTLMEQYLDPIDELENGCIVWLAVTHVPQHVAIYTKENTIIHAVNFGPNKVVENGFTQPWPQKLKGIYKFRGLE